MRPTVFFARADGIHLRLLYSLRLGWQSVLDQHYRKPFALIKGDGPASSCSQWPRAFGLWRNGRNRQKPIEEGWRSGTTTQHPETDIVVTVGGMIVVTIDGARIVLIVDPRAAPQVRRSEPHSFPKTAPAS